MGHLISTFKRANSYGSNPVLNLNKVQFLLITALVSCTFLITPALSQQTQESQPYPVGNPLGLPEYSTADGEFEAISPHVKVYGALYSAESCAYDAERGVIVAPNRGVPEGVRPNDAWISLLNHDGSVHTSRWIGIQNAEDRAKLTPPLVLNDPLGSEIVNGILYLADRDGGTGDDDPSVAVIRLFDIKTGRPVHNIRIDESPWINDLAVVDDGTIYASQTGDSGDNADPGSWRIWKISPEGEVSVFAKGAPLHRPNGVALDPDGHIVVANFGNADVLTYSEDGELLKTETAAQAASDGLVIMPDGTKYICSVRHGGVSRIRPGEAAELIARNIPSAASMCYDVDANQLVIPMTSNNTFAFISLDD